MNAGSDPPVINITGEKIALGPIRRDLVPLYLRWINDFEVTRTMGIGWRPMTQEAEEAWYERACKADDGALFTIYERETMRPVGNTSLGSVNLFQRTAEFGLVIGEKECWGRGYGTEAARLMLDYGFHGLGLHNIMLRVVASNERGIRAYRRAGFKEFGRLRESFRIGGCVFDTIYMDCLSTEFESPVLAKIVADLAGPDVEDDLP